MAEPHWTSYVGMVTGLVGTLSGIAGAWMGFVSYRRSGRLKISEQRLQLLKAVADLHLSLSETQDLLPRARQSRRAVASAAGILQSGAMQIWDGQFEVDTKARDDLAALAPAADVTFDHLGLPELESRLVHVHKLQGQVDQLKEKYRASLKTDDDDRAQIAASWAKVDRSTR